MNDIFVEQFFVLINLVWDNLSPAHNMTDFGQIYYLKISPNNNIYTRYSDDIINHHAWLGRCFKK